jgi:hypothetical protein
MNLARSVRLTGWNIHSWRRNTRIWLAPPVFLLIGLTTTRFVSLNPNLLDANVWYAVLLAFIGPGLEEPDLVTALRWLLPHIVFFFIIGEVGNEELLQRGYAVLHRVGSRRAWWLGKAGMLLILALVYTLLWMATVLACAAIILPLPPDSMPFSNLDRVWPRLAAISLTQFLVWTILLNTSSLFLLALSQMALSIWLKRSYYAFIALASTAILSWLLGSKQAALTIWLPGSQTMLARHDFMENSLLHFTVNWSLGYNLLLITLVSAVSYAYIRRLDIFNSSPDATG